MMLVKDFFYQTGNLADSEKKAIYIQETLDKRKDYMNEVFFSLYKKELDRFATQGKTALLYIGGAGEHHSCRRDFTDIVPVDKNNIIVKSQLGYIASKTAKRIGNISYLSINSNACASSMYALYEAKKLMQEYDDVIIYGEEWVENTELMLFRQLGIELVCGDGFFILHLCKACKNPKAIIEDVSWVYNNEDRSPFEVSSSGYKKAMQQFKGCSIDFIKLHGSGTKQNTQAEIEAINEMFGSMETVEFKTEIGHTQGVSTGIEICMLIDKYIQKDILVNASGLGNFYGSCYVRL